MFSGVFLKVVGNDNPVYPHWKPDLLCLQQFLHDQHRKFLCMAHQGLSQIQSNAEPTLKLRNAMSHIRHRKQGKVGYITLDRPEALNSLIHSMVTEFHQALRLLEADTEVEAIVVRSSNDRAFCAGGDMKTARLLALDEKWQELQQFFKDEYALNLHIANCNKPYISLVNGIAMGGGLGLSVHGNAMIVNESTKLAMPETAIGFFPDVGGTYFLNQLTHHAGMWLGLTGIPVSGPEAVAIGLATHHVPSKKWESFTTALEQSGAEALDTVLPTLADTSNDHSLEDKITARQRWFNTSTQDELISTLSSAIEKHSGTDTGKDAQLLLERLQRMSPFAMSLTRQLLNRAKDQDLATCLQLELKAAEEAARHPDFVEGIRAVLVDKEPAVWSS